MGIFHLYSQDQMSNRINWIDWAKSLGIFLVVVGHMFYPNDLQYPKYLIYGFHMSFFFQAFYIKKKITVS